MLDTVSRYVGGKVNQGERRCLLVVSAVKWTRGTDDAGYNAQGGSQVHPNRWAGWFDIVRQIPRNLNRLVKAENWNIVEGYFLIVVHCWNSFLGLRQYKGERKSISRPSLIFEKDSTQAALEQMSSRYRRINLLVLEPNDEPVHIE